MKLLNAFSIQMLDSFPTSVDFKEVDKSTLDLSSMESYVGHQDTANVLGVSMNRVFCKLAKGETAVIAQLMGGRLPEGSTTLPEGFTFKFIEVTVK